ncbi:MAG: helix-turn-helix domain-containing protein [Candidatus Paceibacterota bacterium]|jgi:transcriptional regulator with XRE-family HTH domain
MARLEEKQKALDLRKKGLSYSQIKKELGINKSTLSGWLRDYPLSKERVRELRDCSEQRIERFRETMRAKREARLNIFYKEEKDKIFPITKRELYFAGLFLYWGEGGKTLSAARLQISNTDPAAIKFFINWLEILGASRKKIRAQLHLYNDMDANKETNYWVGILNLDKKQFIKPYIKQSLLTKINHKGGFGHGTCSITLGDARLSERIFMALKVISDYSLSK